MAAGVTSGKVWDGVGGSRDGRLDHLRDFVGSENA